MAARTLPCAGEKTACAAGGCERSDLPSGVPEGAPEGTASITIQPLAHISATTSKFLRLIRARMLPRRACVAPFPSRAKRKSLQHSDYEAARNQEPAWMAA